jgi:hypothetical protein
LQNFSFQLPTYQRSVLEAFRRTKHRLVAKRQLVLQQAQIKRILLLKIRVIRGLIIMTSFNQHPLRNWGLLWTAPQKIIKLANYEADAKRQWGLQLAIQKELL